MTQAFPDPGRQQHDTVITQHRARAKYCFDVIVISNKTGVL
jgi:hypothetical protein